MEQQQDVDARLRSDIHSMGDLLGEVIRAQEGPAALELEEKVRALARSWRAGHAEAGEQLQELVQSMDLHAIDIIATAFTIYFDLINLAEDQHRLRVLRARERARGQEPRAESLAAAVAALKAHGLSQEQMAALIGSLAVELVFTAHPTEAKRRTILSKLRRISRALYDMDTRDLLPRERQALLDQIRAEVTALWQTDRSRTARPTVEDEVRTGLYFFESVLWDVVPQLYADMEAALAEQYPGLHAPPRMLTFGSWIGGDRDGNPNVTAAVTAEALRLHRGLGVRLHRERIEELSRRLSISERRAGVDPELRARAETRAGVPERVTFLHNRYPHEPYRIALAQIVAELDEANADPVAKRLLAQTPAPLPALNTAEPLQGILGEIDNSLRAAHGAAIDDVEMAPLMRQASVFGLHVARLDTRQEASVHTAVITELCARLKLANDYTGLDEPGRCRLLAAALAADPPNLAALADLTSESQEALESLRIRARAARAYGPETLGPYVISMAQRPSDVLAVLVLAHWCGASPDLDVVPLFERVADLRAAPAVMGALFDLPAYAAHLGRRGRAQQIMIGYSDSNKESGYVTANWYLYQAQMALTDLCRRRRIQLTLFHGRGGTIARGGGPTYRSILAQPTGTVAGRFRLTEQGEVLGERYSNAELAHRHLEQVLYATLMASAPSGGAKSWVLATEPSITTHSALSSAQPPRRGTQHSSTSLHTDWLHAADLLAAKAGQAYHDLLYETPGVLDFWQQATPIHELGRMMIGSRPSYRRAIKDHTSLRAIPWVFSWTQSRIGVPGWYGLGTALERLVDSSEGFSIASLRHMYDNWPFFRALLDNAQLALAKSDMGIARLYAGLVSDAEVRQRVFALIEGEYTRTRNWVLKISGESDLVGHATVVQRAVRARNPYVDPLNYLQVELLRRYRSLADPSSDEGEALLSLIVDTISGVAAGLRNTG